MCSGLWRQEGASLCLPAHQVVSPIARCEMSPEAQPKCHGAVRCQGLSMSLGMGLHLTRRRRKRRASVQPTEP